MENLLAEFPCVVEIPVAWGDMDAFQHVNNVMYFRYFETARVDYFSRLALRRFMGGGEVGPILAYIDCRFKFPLTFPDTVRVGTRVTKLGGDRFAMLHRAVSVRHGRVAAEGSGTIVTLDYQTQTKTPVPPEVVEQIRAFEATVGNTVEPWGGRGGG